mgnify:CR=1 FL=1
MKKALILAFALFLISSLNCAPTKQEAAKSDEPPQEVIKTEKAVSVPFDLTGTWIETEYWSGCGESNKKRINTYKITQQGDTIHIVDAEKNVWYIGKIYKNSISFKGIQFPSSDVDSPGQIVVGDFTFMIGQDGNTLTGKSRWTWQGDSGDTCEGISDISSRRIE